MLRATQLHTPALDLPLLRTAVLASSSTVTAQHVLCAGVVPLHCQRVLADLAAVPGQGGMPGRTRLQLMHAMC